MHSTGSVTEGWFDWLILDVHSLLFFFSSLTSIGFPWFFLFNRRQNSKFLTVRSVTKMIFPCLKDAKLVLQGVQFWFEFSYGSLVYGGSPRWLQIRIKPFSRWSTLILLIISVKLHSYADFLIVIKLKFVGFFSTLNIYFHGFVFCVWAHLLILCDVVLHVLRCFTIAIYTRCVDTLPSYIPLPLRSILSS